MKNVKKIITVVLMLAIIGSMFALTLGVSAAKTVKTVAEDTDVETIDEAPVLLDAAIDGEEDVAPAPEQDGESMLKSTKAWAAGIAIAVVAAAGALAMGITIGKTVSGIARQPEAEGPMRTTLMLGLVFIETAIIYALIVAILIIFVL